MKTRKQELQARIDAANEKHAAELEKIERESRILAMLPETAPLPRFVFAGTPKLYGTQAALSYGESYSFGGDKYTLADALELVDSIGGEPVDLFTVRDSCLAIKPEPALTDKESERAEIDGPFYGMKITRDYHSGAKLSALVMLQGEQIEIRVALADCHSFGGWACTHARSGAPYRGQSPEHEAKYVKRPATLGQAKTVQYGGGSYTGTGSAGNMVYLFDCREALQAIAETMARKAAEQKARLGGAS